MAKPSEPKDSETISVAIPKSLAERIGRRLGKSGFKTVDEYLTFVMQQVVSELERAEQAGGTGALSASETASMEQKLKDLGYA